MLRWISGATRHNHLRDEDIRCTGPGKIVIRVDENSIAKIVGNIEADGKQPKRGRKNNGDLRTSRPSSPFNEINAE